MGWLREQMDAAHPQVGSFGVLADLCLSHPAWPASIRPKPRSLAALFSKFDRDIELEWLSDRPRAQQVLGLVLGCPIAALQAHLELPDPEEGGSRYRFHSAPQLRALELLKEPLPPGLPAVLSMPRRWKRLFWQASWAEGSELVAAWLSARGLAHCVRCRTAEEALSQLDPEAPNFVLLESRPAEPVEWPATPLCLVCPAPLGDDGEWTALAPAAANSFLEELTRWLSERLPGDGRFELEPALAWLRENQSLAVDFESVVGLVALLDEFGAAAVRARSALVLAQVFVKRRVAQAQVEAGYSRWLEANAFELVVGLAKSTLTESRWPFETPRSREEWIELVPAEFRRSVDVEWTKLSLAQAGTPLSVEELEGALARLPPGAFRAVSALESARLLVSDERGELRPAPRWLTVLARARAESEIFASSALQWGEGLLQEHAAASIRARLLARFLDGDFDALEAALELEEPSGAAYAVAITTLTECAGLALLAGVSLEDELLQSLWERLEGSLVQLEDGEIRPRLGSSATYADGAFFLAAWALAEGLDPADSTALSPLNPWDSKVVSQTALHEAWLFLESSPAADWVYAGYSLLGRLLATCDALEHRAALPSLLAEAISWPRLALLGELRHGVAALRFQWEQREAEGRARGAWPSVAASLWACWQRAGFPQTPLFDHGAPAAALLWPHLPLDTARELLRREHPLLAEPALALLSRAGLELYVSEGKQVHGSVFEMGDTELAPLLIACALRTATPLGLRTLWRRFPEQLLSALLRAFDRNELSELSALLEDAPLLQTEALVDALAPEFAARGVLHAASEPLRRWLCSRCRSRGAGWHKAYALLEEMERRRGRAKQARGRTRSGRLREPSSEGA